MERWFLICTYPKREMLILFSERDKLPKWTSCSTEYDSEEELIKDNEIPEWKCSKCGGIVKLSYNNKADLIEHKMCFTCDHFRIVHKIAQVDKNRVIIEGSSYHIESDAPGNHFQGFGGRKFKIKRFDSEEIITSKNLWHQGEIPEIWQTDIPNNAEFIK